MFSSRSPGPTSACPKIRPSPHNHFTPAGKDPSVIEAHDYAVTKALEFLEHELLRARQTEKGITTTERTGNAVIAKFRHETARPTDGAYSDRCAHDVALRLRAIEAKRTDFFVVAPVDAQPQRNRVQYGGEGRLARGLSLIHI